MSRDHNHLNHATWECKYHVVFTPKYRKKALFGQLCALWLCGLDQQSSSLFSYVALWDAATGKERARLEGH